MNTIITALIIIAFILVLAHRLIFYALRNFNAVKAGANIGKAGFFVEAKGKNREKK